MKILMINDFLEPTGGAEIFVYSLKRTLEKRGHNIELLGSSKGENLSSVFSRWNSRKWYKKTIKKIESFHPDVVHIHNCARILSPSVVNAALDSKTPVVFTLHDFLYLPQVHISFKNIIGSIKRSLHKKTLSNKRINFISPSIVLAKSMEEYLDVKIKVIPNGVEIPRKITNYNKQILFVGGLTEGKGLQTVAPILNKIKDYEVIVLGDGPLKKELSMKYKNIKFKGFQKPEKYYEDASIIVVPSISLESFGLVVAEAMAYGLCVIGTNKGGISEQIRDGYSGFLFEHGNEQYFEKKLNYLLENPKKIKFVGKNARRLVKENFDWDKIVKEYEEQYQIVIKEFN